MVVKSRFCCTIWLNNICLLIESRSFEVSLTKRNSTRSIDLTSRVVINGPLNGFTLRIVIDGPLNGFTLRIVIDGPLNGFTLRIVIDGPLNGFYVKDRN